MTKALGLGGTRPVLARSRRRFWKTSPVVAVAVVAVGGIARYLADPDLYGGRKKILKRHWKTETKPQNITKRFIMYTS